MGNTITSIIIAAVLIFIAYIVAPWLKERHLLERIKTMVEAAEKLAENQPMDKKAWVIEQLEGMGITITPFVQAAIESAVKQLDIAAGMASGPDLSALLAADEPEADAPEAVKE